jgi:nitrate/TMAO reductase-like tetraheme cytochrome c subunit
LKKSSLLSIAMALASVWVLTTPAYADQTPMPTDAPKSYEAECASCHMAFPPGLLAQKNWQSIMTGLDKHFGTDASLDAKTQTEITNWLVKNAASKYKYSALAPDNRITKSAWFVKEHGELRADVWKRAGVKSAANCMACHKDAASGGFSEKNVQVPAK